MRSDPDCTIRIWSAAYPRASLNATSVEPESHVSKSAESVSSTTDNHVFVVCRDGTFYEVVPEDFRKQRPWQRQHRGEVGCLKPEYRLALARDGYALVKCVLAVFKPEQEES